MQAHEDHRARTRATSAEDRHGGRLESIGASRRQAHVRRADERAERADQRAGRAGVALTAGVSEAERAGEEPPHAATASAPRPTVPARRASDAPDGQRRAQITSPASRTPSLRCARPAPSSRAPPRRSPRTASDARGWRDRLPRPCTRSPGPPPARGSSRRRGCPTMCAPRISPYFLSRMIFTKPSVSPAVRARPLALNGKRPTW